MTSNPRSITVGTGELEDGRPVIMISMTQSSGSNSWQYLSFREAMALGERIIEATKLGRSIYFADERFSALQDAAIAEHEGRE